MTSTVSFDRTPAGGATGPGRLAEILRAPGFGSHFTDHMVTMDFDAERGWHAGRVGPHRPLDLPPAAAVLNYGQAVFEGLKAYRWADGTVRCFRPAAHAARFRRSARRLAMPELPEDLFLASLKELAAADDRWIPSGSGRSLYFRPLMVSTSPQLAVVPGSTYRYVVIAAPVESYFGGGGEPVSVWVSTDQVRAAPGGTGAAKCAGNYAASLAAQRVAAEHGCDQVVWLDATERRWLEEMGAMNLFLVFGELLVTPELTDSILPGVTRDSLLRLAEDAGYRVEERRVSFDEWRSAAASGELTETFACGTAAVITPVGAVRYPGGPFSVGDGGIGPVTHDLRARLTAVQEGGRPDPYGWSHRLDG